MNDSIEIKKFKKGNKLVFEKIYDAYAPNMYSHCLRMARNEEDAKDMLQESFIKVYKNRKQFDATQSLGGWIRKIVINTSLNFIKKNYKVVFEDIELVDNQIQLIDEHEDSLSKESLKLAIRNLPEGYRIVFELFVVEGLTHPEIAEYLNISVNTSKSQLFKARKMLQSVLNTNFKEERILNVS